MPNAQVAPTPVSSFLPLLLLRGFASPPSSHHRDVTTRCPSPGLVPCASAAPTSPFLFSSSFGDATTHFSLCLSAMSPSATLLAAEAAFPSPEHLVAPFSFSSAVSAFLPSAMVRGPHGPLLHGLLGAFLQPGCLPPGGAGRMYCFVPCPRVAPTPVMLVPGVGDSATHFSASAFVGWWCLLV